MPNTRNAQWYIDILDAMDEMVLVKGDRSRLLWANRAFREAYGMSNEEMFNLVDAPQADPDNTLQYVRDDHQVLTTGERLSALEPMTLGNGRSVQVQTSKTAILGTENHPERTVGVSRLVIDGEFEEGSDKTIERKTIVQTLRTIVRGLPIATVVLDVQMRIVAASQSFEKIAEVDQSEFEKAFSADAQLLAKVSAVIENGGHANFSDFVFGKTNQVFDVSIQEWSLPGQQRGGVFVTFNDVTALRENEALKKLKAELELKNRELHAAKLAEKEQSQKVTTLLDTLSNAVIVCRKDGAVELVNDEATKVFGPVLQKDRARFNIMRAEMFDAQNRPMALQQTPSFRALTGEVVAHELVMIPEPKTAKETWFDVSARPFVFGDTEGAVTVFTNITQRIKLQNELEEFAYITSHDLQEPLRMISSYLTLLEEEFGDSLQGDARTYMGFVLDGSRRMQNLVQDLLKFSRSDASIVELQEVDLTRILDEARASYAVAIADASARIEFSGENIIVSDIAGLRQIFCNLIGNAIKFRRPGVPPIVKVSCQRNADSWTISVSDNGIGIPKNFIPHCFKIFKRAHSESEYPGTGIGLALVKRLTSRLRGHIHVTSSPNVGSVFSLTIPSATITTEWDVNDF